MQQPSPCPSVVEGCSSREVVPDSMVRGSQTPEKRAQLPSCQGWWDVGRLRRVFWWVAALAEVVSSGPITVVPEHCTIFRIFILTPGRGGLYSLLYRCETEAWRG